jgi:hypothetical protein
MSTSTKGFNPITTMSDTSEKASNNDSTKKRSASVLSHTSDGSSSHSICSNENTVAKINNSEFVHHIKQTFLGPVCTACKRKVANGNILFNVSRNSIKLHMTNNQCYNGDFATFKPKVLEDHLRSTMQKYHTTMKNNTSLAARWVKENTISYHFPNTYHIAINVVLLVTS